MLGGGIIEHRAAVMSDEVTSVSATSLTPAESNQLLTAVDVQLAAGRLKADPTERRLTVSLEDRSLWTQFHRLTNEMIVTKTGRYIFHTVAGLQMLRIHRRRMRRKCTPEENKINRNSAASEDDRII